MAAVQRAAETMDSGQGAAHGEGRWTVQRAAGTDRDGAHGQKTKSEGEEERRFLVTKVA